MGAGHWAMLLTCQPEKVLAALEQNLERMVQLWTKRTPKLTKANVSLIVSEKLFLRASNVAGWLLGLNLPPLQRVDWNDVARLRADLAASRTEETQKALHAALRLILSSPKSVQTGAIRRDLPAPAHIEGNLLFNMHDVFALLKTPYSTSNARALTKLSRDNNGPVHGEGRGNRFKPVPVPVFLTWYEPFEKRMEAKEAIRRDLAASAQRPLDIRTRHAIEKGQQQQLLPELNSTAKSGRRKKL